MKKVLCFLVMAFGISTASRAQAATHGGYAR
jgi:hypothetical protein